MPEKGQKRQVSLTERRETSTRTTQSREDGNYHEKTVYCYAGTLKDDLILMADNRSLNNSPQVLTSEVTLHDRALIAAVIIVMHAGMAASLMILRQTVTSIPWFTLLFYMAVLSPSMVLILRDRPMEGISLALPFFRRLPLWTAVASGGSLLVNAGLGYVLTLIGGGDAFWPLEVLRAILLNMVVLAFISASAASLGLYLGFTLDRHRLD